MQVITKYINLKTKGNSHIIDITSEVNEVLSKAELKAGNVTIFVQGSTGALTTIEYEPALVKDLNDFFEKIIPSDVSYAHDATWGDANGYAHLRASLLGPSLVIPFTDGKLTLGTWQQIIFIDFDNRPRSRKLTAQFIGK